MRLSLGNWLKENFGLVATLLGFVVDTITLIALVNSKVPPTIPFIDYPLDDTIQLVILAIAAVTYLGFLQGYWLQLRRKAVSESAHSFLGFLIYDLFLRFKHPFLLVPIVILIGFLFVVVPGIQPRQFVIPIFIFSLLLPLIAFQIENDQEKREWGAVLTYEEPSSHEELSSYTKRVFRRGANLKLSTRWKARIEDELDTDGSYVTDFDLAQMHDCSRSVARKAMRSYFNAFESDKKVKLFKDKGHPKTGNSGSTELLFLSRELKK